MKSIYLLFILLNLLSFSVKAAEAHPIVIVFSILVVPIVIAITVIAFIADRLSKNKKNRTDN